MRFLLTYRNGNTEEVQTDAQTIEDQCMRSFGLSLEEADEFGTKVEIIGDDRAPDESAPEVVQDAEIHREIAENTTLTSPFTGNVVSDLSDETVAADLEAQRQADAVSKGTTSATASVAAPDALTTRIEGENYVNPTPGNLPTDLDRAPDALIQPGPETLVGADGVVIPNPFAPTLVEQPRDANAEVLTSEGIKPPAADVQEPLKDAP